MKPYEARKPGRSDDGSIRQRNSFSTLARHPRHRAGTPAPRVALDAGEGCVPMTTTDWITVFAAVVSFGSMVAAIVSARNAGKNAKIAEQAKDQAKQTALLGQRTEAIDHLHTAVSDIKKSRVVNSIVKLSIEKAKQRAGRVFSSKVGNDLGRAFETADSLIRQRVQDRGEGLSQKEAIDEFLPDLQSLIGQMNNEAILR
jgi:hypothetical protein